MEKIITKETIVGLFNNCKSTYSQVLSNYPFLVNTYLSTNAGAPYILSIKYQELYGKRISEEWICRILTLYSLTTQKPIRSAFILVDNQFGDLLFWINNEPDLQLKWQQVMEL
jgi:hypothetical protein